MDFDLDDEHDLIRRTVRDFAEQEVAPVAEDLDREKRFPYEIVAKLGELGLMGIPFPEEYGGAGADTPPHPIALRGATRIGPSGGGTPLPPTAPRPPPLFPFRPPGPQRQG